MPICARVWHAVLMIPFGALIPIGLAAEEPPPGSRPVSIEVQEQFARWFAPRFVFHPDEQYLPCSPLDPAGTGRSSVSEPGRAPLGDVRSRVTDYARQPLAAKAAAAKVFYRMYPRDDAGDDTLVLEYWLYYVYSQYRAQSVVFRFSADASHPNDMEHVMLVLRRAPGPTAARPARRRPRDYELASILASAHTAGVPNNIYNLAGFEQMPQHVRILVELGSHAMAPDIDGDLRFVPGRDVTPVTKTVWGIRDRGATGSRYRPTYTESRAESAVELVPDTGAGHGLTYALEPVESLEAQFEQLDLDDAAIGSAFRVDVGWVKRMFGKANGAHLSLIRPSRHHNYGAPDRMRTGHRSDASGINTGVTNILGSHAFFVSGRYAWMHASSVVPDVTLSSQAILTGQGRDFYGLELLATYPIDTLTRVFVGGGLLADDIRFSTVQLDWITGFEVSLGRFRFRQAFRTTGAVNPSGWAEFRAEWKAW